MLLLLPWIHTQGGSAGSHNICFSFLSFEKLFNIPEPRASCIKGTGSTTTYHHHSSFYFYFETGVTKLPRLALSLQIPCSIHYRFVIPDWLFFFFFESSYCSHNGSANLHAHKQSINIPFLSTLSAAMTEIPGSWFLICQESLLLPLNSLLFSFQYTLWPLGFLLYFEFLIQK